MSMQNSKAEITWQRIMDEGHQSYLDGFYDNAELLYKTALKTAQNSRKCTRPTFAKLLIYMADLYSDWQKYALAESFYRHALAISFLADGVEKVDEAILLKRISEMCRAQSKSDQAAELNQRADKLLRTTRKQLERLFKKEPVIWTD